MKKRISIYEYFEGFSKEQVNSALNKLSKKDWEVLTLKYGNDLDNPVLNENMLKKDMYRINSLILKIKKILNGEHQTRKQYWNSDMSIYDYFTNYTKEEIDTILSKLDDDDKKLLELRCGKDLENPIKSKMTRKETRQFTYTLVPKMKRMLENPEQYINYERFDIYKYFDSVEKERIEKVLLLLNEEEKDMLKLRVIYENGIVKTTEKDYQRWMYLIKKLEKLIKSDNYFMDINTRKVHKNIYGYFEEYTKEQVNTAIENLEQDDISLLNLIYNNNLLNPNSIKELDKKENDYINRYLVPKIKSRLLKLYPDKEKVRKIKTIYDRFPNYSKEEIDNMLKKLNSTELKLVQLKYGDDLDNPVTNINMTESQKNQFEYIVKYRMRRLLMEPDHDIKINRLGLSGIYTCFSNCSKEEVDKVINSLTELEKGILKIKYGDNYDSSVPKSFLTLEEYKTYCDIMLKIQKLLEKINVKKHQNKRMVSIYQMFKGFTEEQINYVLNTLNEEEKRLIELKFGSDLHNPVTSMFMTKEEKKKVQYTLLVTVSKKLEVLSRKNRVNNIGKKVIDKINGSEMKQLLEIISSEKYIGLLKKYCVNDIIILILYFNGINGNNFSMRMISDYLDIDIKKVENVILEYLLTFSENPCFQNENKEDFGENVQFSKIKL